MNAHYHHQHGYTQDVTKPDYGFWTRCELGLPFGRPEEECGCRRELLLMVGIMTCSELTWHLPDDRELPDQSLLQAQTTQEPPWVSVSGGAHSPGCSPSSPGKLSASPEEPGLTMSVLLQLLSGPLVPGATQSPFPTFHT